MKLPEPLTKNIDEIKTASNRVLILVLIFGMIAQFIYFSRKDKEKDKEIHALQKRIDDKNEADNARLRKFVLWQDSLVRNLQHLSDIKR